MKRVLFVDDEPNILAGLRRTLRVLRHEWQMEFADNPTTALQLLAEQGPFDVVVSDIMMQERSGILLLEQVKREYPGVARIVLSGNSDQGTALASTQVAHQYLAKPCDTEVLKSALQHSMALQQILGSESLRKLVGQSTTLPSPPELYQKLVEEINSPLSDIRRISSLIEDDVAMTAKILQMVNSAFFGLRRNISKVSEAVNYLGLDTVRALVLMNQLSLADQGNPNGLDIEQFWLHSKSVAELSRIFADSEDCSHEQKNQAFLAGLLHDVGYLVLANDPLYKNVIDQDINQPNAWKNELTTLGCTHAEVGGFLLGLWGLPDSLVEPVVYHHQPSRYPGKRVDVVTFVHMANAFSEHQRYAPSTGPSGFDKGYLEQIDFGDRLNKWQALAGEKS